MKTKFLSVIVFVALIAGVIAISCSKEKSEVVPTTNSLKATCNWYGTTYPVCVNTSSGWGWENNKSCIAAATCTGAGQSCSGCSSSSSSSSGGSCPGSLSCPSGISCGCYTVNGLGTQKTAMKNKEVYWMASGMMETESLTTNYTYGDGKSGDSFNAGRCKQNYGAARSSGVGQGSTGALWNYCTNLNNDYTCWAAIRSHYGSNYWSVHRGGTDWPRFKSANDWTYNQVNNGHTTDNTRFWCSIPSI